MTKRDSLNVMEELHGTIPAKPPSFIVDGPLTMLFVMWDLVRNMLRGYVFYPLEQRLLEILMEASPAETREILRTQIAEINCIDRTHYGRYSETLLMKTYIIGRSFRRKKVFSFQDSNVILATIKFKCEGRKYKVDFFVLANKLTFLEYNKNTKEILSNQDIEVLEMDLEPSPVDEYGKAISK